MKGTRFIEVLSAVKPLDMKLLEEFITSPVFNKNKRIISAFSYVKSSSNEVTKGNLAKAGFGNEKYTDANFRMFVSDFTNLIEQFLIYKNSNETIRKVEIMNFAGLHGLGKSFEKHSSELYKKLSSKPAKNTNDYYILFTIESLKRDSASKIDDLADLMYLSMKLDIAISLLSEGKMYNDSSGLIDKGYLKIGINKHEHVFVYTKLLVFSLLSSKKDTSAELELMAAKYCNDKEYYKYIVDVLLWYYRKVENHSKEFQLIKELDHRNMLASLEAKLFLMMIDSGLAINDLTSVLHLYNKYKDLVNKRELLLGKAYIEIYKRNYDGALEALSGIDLKDPFYYEQSVNIKLLIYKNRQEKDLYRYTKDALSHWKKRQLKK